MRARAFDAALLAVVRALFRNRQLDDFAVELDHIGCRLNEAGQGRHDASIHLDASGDNHFFAITPRAEARVGHRLLQSDALLSAVGEYLDMKELQCVA